MKPGPKPTIPTCGHPEIKHAGGGLCRRCYDRAWIKRKYEESSTFRDYHRKRYLFKRYGITREQYAEMLEAQDFRCAICKGSCLDENERFHALQVDHDHTTGKVRGLLCRFCNSKLGWYENRKDVIHEYVKRGIL